MARLLDGLDFVDNSALSESARNLCGQPAWKQEGKTRAERVAHRATYCGSP